MQLKKIRQPILVRKEMQRNNKRSTSFLKRSHSHLDTIMHHSNASSKIGPLIKVKIFHSLQVYKKPNPLVRFFAVGRNMCLVPSLQLNNPHVANKLPVDYLICIEFATISYYST